MSLLHSVAKRDRRDELMDDPQLSSQRHEAALRGLTRLNAISGSVRVIWRPIYHFAKRLALNKLRVLDIATGSGDIPIALWKKARHGKLDLEIQGIDISPNAIEAARARAQAQGAAVEFVVRDALRDELPADFDVITTSLFLHHLADEQIVALLGKMQQAANRMVLVNDLVRSPANLLMVRLASHLVTRSDVVHVDGPLSVRAAFKIGEIRELAEQAGLDGASVSRRWPCRFLLELRKP